jgi:hypothetical protein
VTDILESPVTSALDDDSPLARLFAMVGDDYTDAEQRDDAQTAAAHHVYNAYGSTIGQVLEDMDWAGQTPVKDNRLEASAIAWLEGGLWLHHTLHISQADGARDVLTLIVPCCRRLRPRLRRLPAGGRGGPDGDPRRPAPHRRPRRAPARRGLRQRPGSARPHQEVTARGRPPHPTKNARGRPLATPPRSQRPDAPGRPATATRGQLLCRRTVGGGSRQNRLRGRGGPPLRYVSIMQEGAG